MLEGIIGLPPTVAAFKATGKVHRDDYEKILIPEVDKVAKIYGKINFLLVLETNVANYSLGAWIDDAWIGLKHFTQWQKIAIVSNQNTVKKITDMLGHLVPGKAKGFKLEDLETAKKWVAE